MKPSVTLAQTRTPAGGQLTLQEHDGQHYLKINGKQLMSTTATTSELLLARVSCEPLRRAAAPRVLIGGLGLGFTLRKVAGLLGRGAVIHVAELIPEVVDWNRQFLLGVNGDLLSDPRVEIFVEDAFDVIRRASKSPYDSILLDLDNGPTGFVKGQNSRIYDRGGFTLIGRALKPSGSVAFWSACEDASFLQRLSGAGFQVEVFEAKAYPGAKRAAHRIYLASRGAPTVTAASTSGEPRKSVSR